MKRSMVFFVLTVLLCFSTACAPTPNDTQIETAIRSSLSQETLPPELNFNNMEVPMRAYGKANVVLWTADREIQRNYSLEYDKKIHNFAVTSFTTSHRNADESYSPVPNDSSLVLTELASHFDFSADFGQQYLLLYAGEGDSLATLRTKFESEKLSNMTTEQLSNFEVCDLGGDTLILLVPRYKELSVWINEIEHRGDMMTSGTEVARFGDMPVYIYCDFSDKLPLYEVHISFDDFDEFFTTRDSLITSIK